MLRLRSILFTLALLVIAPLLVLMGASAYVLWEMPPSQGERVRGPHGLIGVQSRGSYAWVIPLDDASVVVVDTGLDADATSLLAEIRGRELLAVLLTHGHPEQVMGLSALPEAPIYVGADDVGLVLGTTKPSGWLASWFASLLDPPVLSTEPILVSGGETVTFGEMSIQAVHVPGHTEGSLVWAWEDVLFTGGALLASSPPRLAPSALSHDAEQAERSLEKLLPFGFDHVADSHSGIVSNARADLHRLLGVKADEPTVRLRGPTRPSQDEGPEIDQGGIYVQTALPGADGLAPALLLLDSGEEWVLSSTPEPAHAAFVGRRVTVRGRLLAPDATPGLPSGLVLEVESVSLDMGEKDAAEELPLVATQGELLRSARQWVRVAGRVRSLDPLARGAAFGEGQFTLPDGSVTSLSAPMSIAKDAEVTLVARILEDKGGLHISAAHAVEPPPTP